MKVTPPRALRHLADFHPNPAQCTLVATLTVTWLVGGLLRSPLLFLMAATCLSLIALAMVVRRFGLAAVQCELLVSERATEDEVTPWRLRLRNTGRAPVFSLQASIARPDFIAATDSEFGGFIGLLLPGETVEFNGSLRCELRGRRSFGVVRLSAADPLGLVSLRTEHALAAEVLVLPRRLRLGGAPAAAAASSVAHHRAAAHAQSGDFRGTREFQPGDPLRRIHWKWTAKLGEYRVVDFEDETRGGVTIALDLNRDAHVGTGKEATIEYAVRIVASLAEHSSNRDRAVTVVWPEAATVRSLTVRHRRDRAALLEQLALAQADSTLTADELLASARRRQRRDTQWLVVTPALPSQVGNVAGTVVWLDASSFTAHPPTHSPIHPIPHSPAHPRTRAPAHPRTRSPILIIRRGDDLRRKLEALA